MKSLLHKYRQYWQNLYTTFLSQAISGLTILLLSPFLIQHLGEEQFGLYGLLILNIIPLSIVADLGLNTGLLRRLIHEPEKASSLISVTFFYFIAITPIAFGIYMLLFTLGWVKSPETQLTYAALLSLILLLTLLSSMFDIVIQSVNKIYLARKIRMVKLVIEAIMIFSFAYYMGLLGVFIAYILSNIIYVLLLWYYANRERPFKISKSYWHIPVLLNHMHYSTWYFIAAVAQVLVFNAQAVLLGSLMSATVLAHYILVTRFYDVAKMALSNFTMILFPSIAQLEVKQDWVTIQSQLKKVTIRMTLLCVAAAIVFFTIGKWIFVQWSQLNQSTILPVFIGYGVLLLLLVLEHIPIVFLTALKWNKLPSIVSVLQGVLGLILSYFFIPIFGAMGIIYAGVLALLGTSFWFSYWYLIREIRKKQLNGSGITNNSGS